jgi:hypothetical protein
MALTFVALVGTVQGGGTVEDGQQQIFSAHNSSQV